MHPVVELNYAGDPEWAYPELRRGLTSDIRFAEGLQRNAHGDGPRVARLGGSAAYGNSPFGQGIVCGANDDIYFDASDSVTPRGFDQSSAWYVAYYCDGTTSGTYPTIVSARTNNNTNGYFQIFKYNSGIAFWWRSNTTNVQLNAIALAAPFFTEGLHTFLMVGVDIGSYYQVQGFRNVGTGGGVGNLYNSGNAMLHGTHQLNFGSLNGSQIASINGCFLGFASWHWNGNALSGQDAEFAYKPIELAEILAHDWQAPWRMIDDAPFSQVPSGGGGDPDTSPIFRGRIIS